jgi:hypothetical protein
MAAVEKDDNSTFGRRPEEASGGGVSPVFVGVAPEIADGHGPVYAVVCPVIAELSDPDSVWWKVGRWCENPTC